jgi:hypothetical protein
MIGRFAAAVAVLTIPLGATPELAVPATVAPFAEFEVIMWQDHSPAEMAGLSRLGFTGVKLTGTGGRVDSSKLAADRASGLSWCGKHRDRFLLTIPSLHARKARDLVV